MRPCYGLPNRTSKGLVGVREDAVEQPERPGGSDGRVVSGGALVSAFWVGSDDAGSKKRAELCGWAKLVL
jgi:hypothetical protein